MKRVARYALSQENSLYPETDKKYIVLIEAELFLKIISSCIFKDISTFSLDNQRSSFISIAKHVLCCIFEINLLTSVL